MTHIGEQLAAARRAAGMTQRELADAIGTYQPNIARIERGGRLPTWHMIEAICGALKLDVVLMKR